MNKGDLEYIPIATPINIDMNVTKNNVYKTPQ
jgi:hypothetical protein